MAGKLDDTEKEHLLRIGCPCYVAAVGKGKRLAAKHAEDLRIPATQRASASEDGGLGLVPASVTWY